MICNSAVLVTPFVRQTEPVLKHIFNCIKIIISDVILWEAPLWSRLRSCVQFYWGKPSPRFGVFKKIKSSCPLKFLLNLVISGSSPVSVHTY